MPRLTRTNIGVIGLGIIGRRIADHLRHRGHSVFVWNRTPRAVPGFVGSALELAQMCELIQIFVADDDALMRTLQMVVQALTPRHLVLVHSTVSPDTVRQAQALIERRGARMVEAPFTGSKLAAEKGQLVYYVAGEAAALQEARPILEASSKAIVEIGSEIGQAAIIKVATNMVTAAAVQSAAEAMAIVRNSGIGLDKFADALKHNASYSPTLEMKMPRIIAEDFEPHFSVKHMLKDMQIANRLGRGFDLDLTVAGATRDRLLDEARQGRGDADFSSIARRFLPPLSESMPEVPEPDLFSQTSETGPAREEPDFVEAQLAALAQALAQSDVPIVQQEAAAESEPTVEPEMIEAEVSAVIESEALVSPQSEKETVSERRNFFARLLHKSTE
ncbi:MAG: NAD(P)-dependent oxidoreductase [Verrucomicrobiota bacterium]|nr:NAD(P)-dependent oxidoreductase [Verrucomicrobiota bacterium]